MALGGVGWVLGVGVVTTVNSPVSREGDISKACDIGELISRPLRYIFFCYYRRSPPRWSQENGLNIFN